MINSNSKVVNGLSRAMLALLLTGLVACSTPDEKAASYYQKGSSLLEKGEFEKAKLEFRNALQIRKNMVNAWYGLAQVAEKQGDWQGLFELLRKVLELDPKHKSRSAVYCWRQGSWTRRWMPVTRHWL
jgi:tetratricopeptide (TPR) repeat protein